MIGRRIPIPIDLETGWPNINLAYPFEPGDYCGPIVGYTGDLPAVFFLLPIARDEGVHPGARSIHHATFPPHTYRECPDGSLEIRNSILSFVTDWETGERTNVWHGYLDEGHVWRTC